LFVGGGLAVPTSAAAAAAFLGLSAVDRAAAAAVFFFFFHPPSSSILSCVRVSQPPRAASISLFSVSFTIRQGAAAEERKGLLPFSVCGQWGRRQSKRFSAAAEQVPTRRRFTPGSTFVTTAAAVQMMACGTLSCEMQSSFYKNSF
jgi:hypothetical protein